MLLAASFARAESVRAGYADADITPPLGGTMPGYFTERISTGVLDPLRAKVLVLSDRRTTIAIVALDLIGLQAPEIAELRRAIRDRTGIPPGHVFVHSTHTHTGAETPRRFTSDAASLYPSLYPGKADPAWTAELSAKVADSAARALAARVEEPRATLGRAVEETVAFYRRFVMADGTIRTNPGRNNPAVVRPAGAIDPDVWALSFDAAKTIVASYALHPDCVGGTRYSADYPYHLTEAVREQLGREWNVLYLNAACGNINHIDVRNAAQKSGYEESRRIGRRIAAAVLEARRRAEPIRLAPLDARSRVVSTPLRQVPPEIAERAEREVREGFDARRNFNELFSPAAYVLSRTRDRAHPAEILTLRLGTLALVGLPAETFVEIARDIRSDSPLRPTLVIGLTGGAMGYMPHKEGFAQGGYEAGYRSARYSPETPGLWIAAARRLLLRLADR